MAASSPPSTAPPPPPGEGQGDLGMHRDIVRHQPAGGGDDPWPKHNSETKVGKEIQKLKSKMDQMSGKIGRVAEMLDRLESKNAGLLKTDLQKSIAKLEEVWEGEVGALKHELWQTIQAHNHNADLLKHHKDAIDQVQNSISEAAPNPELEQVHAQLVQVDKVMQREHAKEQQIDQLLQRVSVVQQQLAAGVGGWSAPGAAFLAAAGAGAPRPAAGAAAKKAPQRKAPKAGKVPKAGGPAIPPNLRAEAPEFVPGAG
ncbi:unnamed protein product [Prorocentrum cordatum]|uniref:Uncharacterized protein n=1 Tax=Prorocentrum cordatum TaxID=2364126 RepID=A0ABN9T399_9DINO|nr:unnamed protein product [Polarella glacialis]